MARTASSSADEPFSSALVEPAWTRSLRRHNICSTSWCIADIITGMPFHQTLTVLYKTIVPPGAEDTVEHNNENVFTIKTTKYTSPSKQTNKFTHFPTPPITSKPKMKYKF